MLLFAFDIHNIVRQFLKTLSVTNFISFIITIKQFSFIFDSMHFARALITFRSASHEQAKPVANIYRHKHLMFNFRAGTTTQTGDKRQTDRETERQRGRQTRVDCQFGNLFMTYFDIYLLSCHCDSQQHKLLPHPVQEGGGA